MLRRMCKRLESIGRSLDRLEVMTLKIKAVSFKNFQSFDYVHKNYDVGDVYKLPNIGYTIIIEKSQNHIVFIVIMDKDSIWEKHWQDVDKILEIKQGTYLDMFTGKEYKKSLTVKAFEPSHFKAIGETDLVIKGSIFKQPTS